MKNMILVFAVAVFLNSGCSTVRYDTSATPDGSTATQKESKPSESLNSVSTFATGAVLLTGLLAMYKILAEKCESSSNVSC